MYKVNLSTDVSSTVSLFSLTVKNTGIRDEEVQRGVKTAKICWKINTGMTMVYVP